MDNKVFEKVDRYVSDLLAYEDEVLFNVTKSIEENNLENISVSPNQGKMLQVLARMCNAKKILEVGTFAGYSTIWLARVLPADGKLVTLEFDANHAAIAKKNIEKAGLQSIVEIRIGNAMESLAAIAAENAAPFDMVFIDADKPPYREYFQQVLKLSRPGTIIVADNVIRGGAVLDPNTADKKVQGVQRFNQFLAECPEVTATIIQTIGTKEHDGIAIAVVN